MTGDNVTGPIRDQICTEAGCYRTDLNIGPRMTFGLGQQFLGNRFGGVAIDSRVIV